MKERFVPGVTTCRKSSFTTLCYVFVSSRVPIRCLSFSCDLSRRTTGVRNLVLPSLLSQKRQDTDKIGYKFICCFKRDIVLLLDKAGNLTVRPVHVTCPSYVSCDIEERYSLARVRVCASTKGSQKKNEIRRRKKKKKKTILPTS